MSIYAQLSAYGFILKVALVFMMGAYLLWLTSYIRNNKKTKKQGKRKSNVKNRGNSNRGSKDNAIKKPKVHKRENKKKTKR